ncbi:conjugal transfer protein TraB [Micromonospora sp. NPDC050187]|uniref:conjugal transfer protein TraB n=1 Tax=Micromonospora sp. NPDC050187 TaxID=3364277 RepID=UPI0037925530
MKRPRPSRMPRNGGLSSMSYSVDLRSAALPYLVCPAGCALAWPAAAASHHWWGTNPWAAAGITAAGGGLTALTWAAGRARGVIRQRVSTLLTATGSAWALGATIGAPWERPWLDLWAGGTAAASVAVAVMRLMAKANPDEQATAGGGLAEAVAALRDARIGRPKVDGAKVKATITMPPGETLSEVEGSRESIASALDVAPSAVRVHRDPDSVRTGRIEVVPVDQLRDTIEWAGPSAPGRSVGDAPLRFGVAEDGEKVALWLTGRPGVRPATHVRATGMTGSGKTEWALVVMTDYLTRSDGALVVVDTVKRDQTVKPVKDGLALLVTEDEHAEAFFDVLAEKVIPARTEALGKEDLTEWMPGCSLSHLMVWVEESAAWSGHPALVQVAERARSAGISLVLSQQRWTHDRAPTSLRSQFATNVCFGIDSRDDPSLALSGETVDAGAAPESWGSTKPGYLYIESPGIPTGRWPIPCRSELAQRSDLAAAVTGWAQVRQQLDPVTAKALAPVMPTDTVKPSPGHRPTPAPAPAAEGDAEQEVPAMATRPGVNPTDPPDDVDPSKELDTTPTPRRFSLALPKPTTPEQARQILRDHIIALAEQGQTEVRPADLGDVLAATGYTAKWLSKALAELTAGNQPLLMAVNRNGRYRILRTA